MPILQDYIANLVTSITDARVSSDEKSAEVALMYQKNEILRDFPIPRMRIGEVVMDVPVAIDFVNETNAINKNPNIDGVTALVFNNIYHLLELKPPAGGGGDLTPPDKGTPESLERLIRESFEQALVEAIANNNLDLLYQQSEELAQAAVRNAGREVTRGPEMDAIINSIMQTFKSNLITSQVEDLRVMVTATDLEVQKPQTLLHVKLTIIEDGMEWAIAGKDSTGRQIRDRLVPE
jgi:hypothetical protein